VDGVATGAGHRCLIGDGEFPDRVAGVPGRHPVAVEAHPVLVPQLGPGALDHQRVAGVVEEPQRVEVVEVDGDGDQPAVGDDGGERGFGGHGWNS
jgi:hypothetical protein